ncbi:MAG: hypothetical protein ACE37I_14480 [Rubinisphaera brasiliensis]|uniref:Uncharacterized protein n=1 Tax=Rubinisphaera brasiliensis (strain ATCC 49424 / DSM 5305 / JCM 21570 / IAM 15109 / NBRC 103401 / IFAM 1448) TaxID=756272 RepID=F0SR29_RUBBR|nr:MULTISPECIES: hypothetical protein [Rubinisphaera]ADY61276.1 hypothetical protein Plabr_3679 [Rubinisphaera brasiliensis DSM 5305]MBR9803367.1 hypothetical protein [bacterium]
MPLKPDRLERSLKLAQQSRSLYESKLDEQNVPAEERKKHPRWRALNAACERIENRIQSANDLATRSQTGEDSSSEE